MYSYIIGIFIFFIIIAIFQNRNKKNNIDEKGKILGVVYSKLTNKEVEGAKVRIGNIEGKEKGHIFKTEEESNVYFTNEKGEFEFNNLELKSYWIMVEYKGKKVLKMAKLSADNKNIDDMLLIV
ncbi:hypothetical protein [Haliovirga abyssi]|uniref:Carboxypeptidase regulatory-like domain-containing protein n=1 Tax=Haliovirga abyssi TaxID=2996794 RepID=A0AAU9DBU2_9FUSO|nr:hypothetical protein [Haliovirga abyssi]BDU50931.1 hypothetical protein HLVA_15000 [Haliovirga abyssi]